jgi:hypothetical protein
MSTALFALAVTAAAVAMTWFFCMRPMLRKSGTANSSCCAPPSSSIEQEIGAAREELERLQNADRATP